MMKVALRRKKNQSRKYILKRQNKNILNENIDMNKEVNSRKIKSQKVKKQQQKQKVMKQNNNIKKSAPYQ